MVFTRRYTTRKSCKSRRRCWRSTSNSSRSGPPSNPSMASPLTCDSRSNTSHPRPVLRICVPACAHACASAALGGAVTEVQTLTRVRAGQGGARQARAHRIRPRAFDPQSCCGRPALVVLVVMKMRRSLRPKQPIFIVKWIRRKRQFAY